MWAAAGHGAELVSAFDGVSYVQRGVLGRGKSSEPLAVFVSFRDGETLLRLESNQMAVAKIKLSADASVIGLEGGFLLDKCAVEKYVLPVFRAILLKRGFYECAVVGQDGRVSEIRADGFSIKLGGYSEYSGGIVMPRSMRVEGENFWLKLELVMAKK